MPLYDIGVEDPTEERRHWVEWQEWNTGLDQWIRGATMWLSWSEAEAQLKVYKNDKSKRFVNIKTRSK